MTSTHSPGWKKVFGTRREPLTASPRPHTEHIMVILERQGTDSTNRANDGGACAIVCTQHVPEVRVMCIEAGARR